MKNGEIRRQFETLMNPESNFNTINLNVHGIQDTDTRNAPKYTVSYASEVKAQFGFTILISTKQNLDK